jgi:hypothetical protein
MQKFIIRCALAMLLASSNMAGADEPAVSKMTCLPVKTKVVNHGLVLDVPLSALAAGQLYFFKNNSQQSLWLDRLNKRASASAGWSSYLRPHNWSALLLDKKEFILSCAVIQPGKVDYVNCGEAISVCMPTHITLTTNRKGSYWLVEDLTWDVFVKMLAKRGVK